MKIWLVTPAPRGTRYGNRMTALRWARILRSLGHRVTVETGYHGQPCDLLIGLHARRSADSMRRFKESYPQLPLVLALTGTDVYQDIQADGSAQHSLELADRIVALQPLARDELPLHLQHKLVPIIQSASPTPGPDEARSDAFEVCVVGHLRPVKDPFRAAMASRLLPKGSRVRIIQVGGALSAGMERWARAEMARNPRYRWVGEQSHWKTRRIIKRSRVMVLSSKLEGGANVVCEAMADGVPVIGSLIPGNVGLLGEEYPGYYPTGDTRALARLLHRAETDSAFLQQLREQVVAKAEQVSPEAERAGWARLLESMTSKPAEALLAT